MVSDVIGYGETIVSSVKYAPRVNLFLIIPIIIIITVIISLFIFRKKHRSKTEILEDIRRLQSTPIMLKNEEEKVYES